jgi:hypothetical protein
MTLSLWDLFLTKDEFTDRTVVAAPVQILPEAIIFYLVIAIDNEIILNKQR